VTIVRIDENQRKTQTRPRGRLRCVDIRPNEVTENGVVISCRGNRLSFELQLTGVFTARSGCNDCARVCLLQVYGTHFIKYVRRQSGATMIRILLVRYIKKYGARGTLSVKIILYT